MTAALWKKTIRDALPQLLASCVLLLGFTWLFVLVISTIKMSALMQFAPPFVLPLVGLPLNKLISPAGQISLAFVDLVTVLTAVGWSVARGSDAISGEIGRGTMEMLLAQPIRRSTHLAIHAAVTILGAMILAVVVMLGTWAGLASVEIPNEPSITAFIPGAINLFFFVFALSGVTTLFSSFDRERWRSIGLGVGFFLVSLVIKIVARIWPPLHPLMYLTFLSCVDPQKLIVFPEQVWELSLRCNGPLFLLGFASYVAAGMVFEKRDLPAPL